jgi:SAM-dependent methyltransferase
MKSMYLEPAPAVTCCPVCSSRSITAHLSIPNDEQALALRRCTACDFIFAAPAGSDRDRHGADYHAQRWSTRDSIADAASLARLLEFWWRRLGWQPGMRLLEVGCAEGRLLEVAQAMGFVARGIDVSDVFVDRWRERALTARVATPERLAAGLAQPFDIIVARQVIEHVADPVSFLEACASMLAPHGTCLIETGDARSAQARVLGRRWNYWIPPGGPGSHISFLGRRSAAALAARAGLRLVESVPSFRHWSLAIYASGFGEVRPGVRTRLKFSLHRTPLSGSRTYRFERSR